MLNTRLCKKRAVTFFESIIYESEWDCVLTKHYGGGGIL